MQDKGGKNDEKDSGGSTGSVHDDGRGGVWPKARSAWASNRMFTASAITTRRRASSPAWKSSLGEKLAEALGYDEVEYTAVTAATRGQMLDNDELDCVIATFTIKPERKESWDFSTPYYVDAVTVLVEDASGITDLAGLKGQDGRRFLRFDLRESAGQGDG